MSLATILQACESVPSVISYYFAALGMHVNSNPHMGVSENRGRKNRTLNSRILTIRTPKSGTPNLRRLPYLTIHDLKGLP